MFYCFEDACARGVARRWCRIGRNRAVAWDRLHCSALGTVRGRLGARVGRVRCGITGGRVEKTKQLNKREKTKQTTN